ncbi:hypothetical protein [Streptomyces sp. NPDC050738]|uniref:hypothetical protein n=1 Tax=Streptomyces sp. NPDC050738 TaxID=3154744 RepID=UPI003427A1B4
MTARPPAPEDEPSLPDDVWERFERDTEGAIRTSAPKEPSARARMVTERLRQQEAAGVRPEAWRAAPLGGTRKRRPWLAVAGCVVAAGVLLFALNPSKALDLIDGSGGSDGAAGAGATSAPSLGEETAQPSSAPTEKFPGQPTLDAPFTGSPALSYADGAAGIVVPKGRPVGGLSTKQVDFALRKTKEFLVAADLDPRTLRGERPAKAISLLDPLQPEMHTRIETALRAPDQKHDPVTLFSRFDPSEVRLVGDVVKTRGRMTFSTGKQGGVYVHADYTFVYPLVKAAEGADRVERTVVRRVLDVSLLDPARYRVTPGKLQIVEYQQDIGNSACEVWDGYLHPQFDADRQTGPAPSGPAVDPYDRSKGIAAGQTGGCGRLARS